MDKQTYTIRVHVMEVGKTGLSVQHVTVQATSLGRAEAQAKRQALKGLSPSHYAYAMLRND